MWTQNKTMQRNQSSMRYAIEFDFFFFKILQITQHPLCDRFTAHQELPDAQRAFLSVAFLLEDAKLPCPQAKRSHFGLNIVIQFKSILMSFDKILPSRLNSTFNLMEKSCVDGYLTQNLEDQEPLLLLLIAVSLCQITTT